MNRFRLLLVALSAALVGALPVRAQTSWPAHPVRLVVPNAAGGGPIDTVGRIVATKLGPLLGQEVIVDNRAGAGQILGTDIVAKAPADGYTIGLIGPAHVTNPLLRDKMPYAVPKDFTPISRIVTFPLILVVNSSSQVNSVADLIALGKSKGADFKYASVGVGTGPHLAAEMFRMSANIRAIHVPFNASPELAAARNDVDFYLDSPSVLTGLGQTGGRLRPLAVSSARRSSYAPQLPPIADTLPGYDVETFIGMVGPANLPSAVVQKLNQSLQTVLAMPDVKERFAQLMYEPSPMSPEEFGSYLDRESVKWGKVIQANGIRVD